jgi:hypothetical protein
MRLPIQLLVAVIILSCGRTRCEPLSLPAQGGTYNDWTVARSSSTGSLWITFTADTTNDVHVGLLRESTLPTSVAAFSANKMYEIVIGGWANTASVFRLQSQSGQFASSYEAGLCNASGADFWISYNYNNAELAFGRGNFVGRDVVLKSRVPQPELVTYFSFSSWDAPVIYTNIRFGDIQEDNAAQQSEGDSLTLDSGYGGVYYDWKQEWKSNTGSISIKFHAKTSNDIHVALLNASEALPVQVNLWSTPLYEVVIGGWGNTQSVLRYNPQTPAGGFAALSNYAVCDDMDGNDYWVEYDLASGVLSVGEGTVAGEATLLESVVPQDHRYHVQYFSFSSWNVPVKYSNIHFEDRVRKASGKFSRI